MRLLYELVSEKSNGSIIDLNSFLNRKDINQSELLQLNDELSNIFKYKDTNDLGNFTEKIVSNLYDAKRIRGNTIMYDLRRNNEYISVKSSNNSINLNATLNNASTKINSLVLASYGINRRQKNDIHNILTNFQLFDLDKNYRKIKDYFNKELGRLSNKTFSLSAVWCNKKYNTIYIIKTKRIDSFTLLNESLREWHNKIKIMQKHNKNKLDFRLSPSSTLNIFNGIRDSFEIILLNSKVNKSKLEEIQRIKSDINNKVSGIYDLKQLREINKKIGK